MTTQRLPARPAYSNSGQPGFPTLPTDRPAGGWFTRRHRQRMVRADLLTVIAWASVAAAVALWLADGGAASISSPAGAFTAAGIVAGLAGMDLVLLMLLLAARIPYIDRTIGHDRALEFHRKLGKPSLYLLLAHGVLLATGYGLAEGLDPLSESVALWVQVPDMWLAFVSMALFIAVVATSLVAVRRRFPYEFWYVVHLLTYVAVGTSLPHQFSVGGLFAEGTWQRWYWLAVCIATGAALAYFRVLQPFVATSRHQLTVSRVEVVAPGVVNISMTGRRLHRLAGSGGRFFIWRFLAPGMWWHPHPFSLSAEPAVSGPDGAGTLRITVRNLGSGSAQLVRLRKGTRVAVEGPYGLLSTEARVRNKVVMIGAGIGITPLRALLETTPFAPGEASVLLRGHTGQELYLSNEILELCRARGARLFHLPGPRSRGRSGWLPQEAVSGGYDLRAFVPDVADSDVYVCGPAGWADSVITDAKDAGVPEDQIHHERFDW
ncbi:Predicted ferric reductase [Pseudarthrobacter enclensis]|uniref:Oxidoreductase n=1 Tax=Pseudarthrobacter enclensis TaxID=993070 RepID=A0A0V8I7P9_9MICC|nr:ferredoxin reductase family protein [Pseudarthrobacter enclensis]KSU70823.1 oxidoreductase [Pseudarthrobacter enclensis]SCC26981.1 Predicted ferric reductase [Pseudarthrobacter enclensis]